MSKVHQAWHLDQSQLWSCTNMIISDQSNLYFLSKNGFLCAYYGKKHMHVDPQHCPTPLGVFEGSLWQVQKTWPECRGPLVGPRVVFAQIIPPSQPPFWIKSECFWTCFGQNHMHVGIQCCPILHGVSEGSLWRVQTAWRGWWAPLVGPSGVFGLFFTPKTPAMCHAVNRYPVKSLQRKTTNQPETRKR